MTFRLIYRSHNRIPVPQRKSELGAIFSVARSQNKKADITGALLISGDWFGQALEGDEPAVKALYDHIEKDRRHERLSVVDAQDVDERVFSRWSMARVSEDGEPDIPLLMNVDKGGASGGATPDHSRAGRRPGPDARGPPGGVGPRRRMRPVSGSAQTGLTPRR